VYCPEEIRGVFLPESSPDLSPVWPCPTTAIAAAFRLRVEASRETPRDESRGVLSPVPDKSEMPLRLPSISGPPSTGVARPLRPLAAPDTPCAQACRMSLVLRELLQSPNITNSDVVSIFAFIMERTKSCMMAWTEPGAGGGSPSLLGKLFAFMSKSYSEPKRGSSSRGLFDLEEEYCLVIDRVLPVVDSVVE